MKRGKWGKRRGQGLKGKEGGGNEKGWEERGTKAHSKNSDFGTPFDLGTL